MPSAFACLTIWLSCTRRRSRAAPAARSSPWSARRLPSHVLHAGSGRLLERRVAWHFFELSTKVPPNVATHQLLGGRGQHEPAVTRHINTIRAETIMVGDSSRAPWWRDYHERAGQVNRRSLDAIAPPRRSMARRPRGRCRADRRRSRRGSSPARPAPGGQHDGPHGAPDRFPSRSTRRAFSRSGALALLGLARRRSSAPPPPRPQARRT